MASFAQQMAQQLRMRLPFNQLTVHVVTADGSLQHVELDPEQTIGDAVKAATDKLQPAGGRFHVYVTPNDDIRESVIMIFAFLRWLIR